MKSEDQINNTFQIKEEFSCPFHIYKKPRKQVKQAKLRGRSGNPRRLSEEQILLYKLRHYKRRAK